MRTVQRIPLNTDRTALKLPAGSRVMCVDQAYEGPIAYVLIDQSSVHVEEYVIDILGAGRPVPPMADYLCTFKDLGGALVWHAFVTYQELPRLDLAAHVHLCDTVPAHV